MILVVFTSMNTFDLSFRYNDNGGSYTEGNL